MVKEQFDLFDNNWVKPEEKPVEVPGTDHFDNIEELLGLSERAYQTVISAQMNEALAISDLESYIYKIFSAGRGHKSRAGARSAAEKVAFDRGDPLVRIVLQAAYRVDHEIHRFMGLLRFNPRPDGIWLARCAPDNFILPAFAGHFTARFGQAPWAIIDEKRSLALLRLEGEDPCFGILSSFPFLSSPEAPQDDWEELWRSYHRSINIDNRKNPALQLQFMPRRYWKYLPELKSYSETE